MKKHCTAIILSSGFGRRMGSSVAKQYLLLEGKPIIYYTIKAFQDSAVIDDIVVTVSEGMESYMQTEIVEKFGFTKVKAIVQGGKERYHSVYRGIRAVGDFKLQMPEEEGFIFIQDGARPFVNEEILSRGYENILQYPACVVGMPTKDTVRIVDENQFTKETPDRKDVWIVQTPQIFERKLITEAFEKLMKEEDQKITDDGMVVEKMMGKAVKMIEGSYDNIKITTPEDLQIAKEFVKNMLTKQ